MTAAWLGHSPLYYTCSRCGRGTKLTQGRFLGLPKLSDNEMRSIFGELGTE
jgi:hypothetical protein